MSGGPEIEALAEGVLSGQRRALARAITLVESSRDADGEAQTALLERLGPHTGKALRLGVSGVPGVGKSTFLEALGGRLLDQGLKVAVLAIDPSSTLSGGSILGDKTRMTRLSTDANAFVRPSPGSGAAGGISPRAREAMTVLEAAGFDLVVIETIGVGQSETAVSDLVDFLLLLVLTGAGDELQGIKRGVLELADGVAVTKADGSNRERAEGAARELGAALHILHGSREEGAAPVWTCSAREGNGLDELWTELSGLHAAWLENGRIAERRHRQDGVWFEHLLHERALTQVFGQADTKARLDAMRSEVHAGRLPPFEAARRVLP